MTIFLAIALTGLGTYLSRALFILLLAQVRFPPEALRVLEYVAPAVMAALVVSMLTTADGEVRIGIPETLGLLSAGLIAWKTRNHVYTVLGAMSVFWMLKALMG